MNLQNWNAYELNILIEEGLKAYKVTPPSKERAEMRKNITKIIIEYNQLVGHYAYSLILSKS